MEVPKDLLEKKGYCPEIGRKESTIFRKRHTNIHLFKYSIMTGRFSQVYVSVLDEVDRVMILEETNLYIVYILNYYIL